MRSLPQRLGELGVHENERNLNNKISRGGFTAGFFVHVPGGDRMSHDATG